MTEVSKVMVGIVLYNPDIKRLIKNINTCLKQVNKILLIDNASRNIAEVLSFGDFIKLYELYYKKHNCKESIYKYLWSVKFLRNAAAHNSCLLNSLKKPYNTRINLCKDINTYISKIDGITADVRKRRMSNPIINDFVVTLYVFNNIVTSNEIKRHSMNKLKNMIDNRFIRNKEYFEKNQVIISYFYFINSSKE